MSDEQYESVDWLGLHLSVPSEWQLVRHGVAHDQGGLVFVDRRKERLRLYYRSSAREPDLERMVDDQRSREQLADAHATVAVYRDQAGWRGVVRDVTGGGRVVHAVRYDSASAQLVELVFTESTAGERIITEHVLEHFRVVSAPAEATLVQAFELSVEYPSRLCLTKTVVNPADVSFEFRMAAERDARWCSTQATVRRRAMAKSWYQGDPLALLRRDLPRTEWKPDGQGDGEQVTNQHPSRVTTSLVPEPRLLRLLRGPRIRKSLVWHCDTEDAVYEIHAISRAKEPLLLSALRVACCSARPVGRAV